MALNQGFKGAIMAQDDRTPGRTPASGTTPKATRTSPGEFVRQVRSETAKVVWPTREETFRTAIFVGIMVVILSLFFLGVDSLFGAVVRWLLSLL